MTRAPAPGTPGRAVVVGAGTMGVRIALCLAQAGVSVCATSRHAGTLRAAAADLRAAAADLRAAAADLRSALPGPAGDVLARIRLAADADDELRLADLVVETIPEDAAAKLAVLGRIGGLVGPDAIVTTNTSALDLAELAGAVPGPGRFAGLHWFNPADLVELVEIVAAPGTSAGTIETLRCWATACGKTPIVLHHAVPGYVANRLQYALLREAYALVADGVCSRADADLAVTRGLGPRWAAVGPFQSMDIAGLDVHQAVARALFPVLSADTGLPEPLAALVRQGHLGAKSGSGLLGDYPRERKDSLARLRDSMLRHVAAIRHAAGQTRK